MSHESFDTLDNQPTIPGEPGGQVLSGRYKIIRKLGEGGMGTVYLAEDTELNMPVAVKVLPTLLANNKRAIDNLRREARTALKLSHPNIVRLHTFQSDESIKYLVMEYVDGGNLEERILAAGALNVEETLKTFTHVAAGLDYAHSQNVLHRDIKPANIMLTKDGVAKLADFGIARMMKDSMTRITGKETSGTLLYMAPEQFRGGEPDHRSDIYSLAASIYECLSGHPPFWRGSIEYQVMKENPASLKKLNDTQNEALLKALAKEPKGRQSNAKELLTDLGADSSALSWQAPAKILKKKLHKDTLDYSKAINIKAEKAKTRKKKIKVFAVSILIAIIIYFIGFIFYQQYRQVNPRRKITDSKQMPAPQQTTKKTRQEQEQNFRNLIDTAFICEAKEDWPKAIEAYTKALQVKPEDTETKDRLSTCQHNLYLAKAEAAKIQENFDSVIKAYIKALSFKQFGSTQILLEDTQKKYQEDKNEFQRIEQEYKKWLTTAKQIKSEGYKNRAKLLYDQFIEEKDDNLWKYKTITKYGQNMDIFIKAGYIEEAKAICEKLIDQKSFYEAGRFFTNIGDLDKAISIYKLYLSERPFDRGAYQCLARAYVANGQIKEAKLLWEEGLKKLSDDFRFFNVGDFFYEIGKLDRAFSLYKRYIEKNPTKFFGRSNLAKVYLKIGKVKKAEAVWEDGLKKSSDKNMLHYAGCFFKNIGQYDRAISLFRQRLENYPPCQHTYSKLVDTYLEDNKKKDAEMLCEKGLKVFSDGAFLLDAARFYGKIGKLQRALSLYKKYIEKEPSAVYGYVYLADTYVKLGRPKDAESVWNDGLKKELRENSLYLAGSTFLKIGEYDRAISLYKKYLGLNPENVAAYSYLSDALVKANRIKEAEVLWKEGLSNSIHKAKFLHAGDFYRKTDRYDKAIDMYQQFLIFYPGDKNVSRKLGLMFYLKGEFEKASHAFAGDGKCNNNDRYNFIYSLASQCHIKDLEDIKQKAGEYSNKKNEMKYWPLLLIRFLSGDISEKEIFKAVSNEDKDKELGQLCEAEFVTGIVYLAKHEYKSAINHFNKCLATNKMTYCEYEMAKSDLEKLEKYYAD